METYDIDFYLHIIRYQVLSIDDIIQTDFKFDKVLLNDVTNPVNEYLSLRYDLDFASIPQNEWKGGSIGIECKSFETKQTDTSTTLTPVVSTGIYSFDNRDLMLHSDYSVTVLVDPLQMIDDYLAFEIEPEANVCQIATYRRDSDYNINVDHVWQRVDDFTGFYNELSGQRVSVSSIDDVDVNVYEYIINYEDNFIILNRSELFKVGGAKPYDPELNPVEVIVSTWEYKGDISGCRRIYTNYFPVITDLFVYQITDSVLVEIPIVDDLSILDTEIGCTIDHALGIIEFSGQSFTPVFLASSISDTDTSIQYVLDEYTNIHDMPSKGILLIGSEKIRFNGRAGYWLLNCERGYDETVSGSYSQGETISIQDFGSDITGDVYISYRYGPRLDYEITNYNQRACNYNSWLDLQKYRMSSETGILSLVANTKHVENLVLSIDLPFLGNDNYGPLYFGDLSTLVSARVTDSQGRPVNNVEIDFTVLDGYGTLDNNVDVRRLSNNNGEAFVNFAAPFTNSLYILPSSVTYDTDTIMYSDVILGTENPNNIYLYHMMKHDNILGTVGISDVVDGEPFDPGILTSFALDLSTYALDENYNGGRFTVYDSDNNSYTREIVTTRIHNSGNPFTRIFFEEEIILSGTTLNGQRIFIVPKDSPDFSFDNSAKVIVYKNNGDAFVPYKPDTVNVGSVTFSGVTFPEASLTDPNNNIGAYLLLMDRTCTLIATAVDPATGRLIVSNEITVHITFNSSILGETNGFTIEGETSSKLSIANWITLNPFATGRNRINIFGNLS